MFNWLRNLLNNEQKSTNNNYEDKRQIVDELHQQTIQGKLYWEPATDIQRFFSLRLGPAGTFYIHGYGPRNGQRITINTVDIYFITANGRIRHEFRQGKPLWSDTKRLLDYLIAAKEKESQIKEQYIRKCLRQSRSAALRMLKSR